MKLEILKNAGLIEESSHKKFKSIHKSIDWLEKNGFSYGKYSSTMKDPIPVKKGEHNLGFWKDLSNEEIKELDGKIIGNYRYGPVLFINY